MIKIKLAIHVARVVEAFDWNMILKGSVDPDARRACLRRRGRLSEVFRVDECTDLQRVEHQSLLYVL